MDSWIQRISMLAPVVLPIAGAIIALLVYVVRLDNDTQHLQEDVSSLKKGVAELQEDVNEVKANQQRILDALENIEVALGNHVHEPDGTVRVTLTSR